MPKPKICILQMIFVHDLGQKVSQKFVFQLVGRQNSDTKLSTFLKKLEFFRKKVVSGDRKLIIKKEHFCNDSVVFSKGNNSFNKFAS